MRGFLLALFSVVIFIGCFEPRAFESAKFNVPRTWKVEDVRLSCMSMDQCPPGVGLLVFLEESPFGFAATRCTASLIAPDRILTADHCDFELGSVSRSYFFLPGPEGSTLRVAALNKIFSQKDSISGLGRDVAIFRLERPLPGVAPLKIARRIPEHLEKLSIFVVDEVSGSSSSHYLLVEKQCSTLPRMPVFEGGVDDQRVGLALFGCETSKGHSGAPLFAGGDFSTVQGLVNTKWLAGEGGVNSLFFEKPGFLASDYTMSERLHCLSLPGFPAPEVSCEAVDLETTIGGPARLLLKRKIREWFAALPVGSDVEASVEWSLVPFEFSLRSAQSEMTGLGAVLMPEPVCAAVPRSPNARAKGSVPAKYWRIGLDRHAHAGARLIQEESVRPYFEATSIALDIETALLSNEARETSYVMSQENESHYRRLRNETRSWKLPPCAPGVRSQALAVSLERADQLRFFME